MMRQGLPVRLAACGVLLVALTGCTQRASAQTADECTAASGVLLPDSTGVGVCYPKIAWPWWNWGCNWHSCRQGFTCVPIATWPYYTCVPLPPAPTSPCCRKNIAFCAARKQFCLTQTWSDITDCANPTFEFCTRRQIAKPECVGYCRMNAAFGINPCPNKCYRCVDTPAGPKCVRICKWPCTWCPFGTFCVDHATNGAMCVPWVWWKWRKAAVDVPPLSVPDTTITCRMLTCPTGVPCVETDSGPQCGTTCAFDQCKTSRTAPAEPTTLRAVLFPECTPGCDPTVVPRLVKAPTNVCVSKPACADNEVCVEPSNAQDTVPGATCQVP